jgi:RNA polymerase sigma factor (sigma-70 family)
MARAPQTRPSLLVRLRDGQDHDAWRQFVELYAPVIFGFARRRGLQDADASDFVQDVLLKVSSAITELKYDPERGQFRGWLYTLTRQRFWAYCGRQRCQVQGSGDSRTQAFLDTIPSKEEADAWDREYEQHLFHWAAERIRGEFTESTWRAFWGVSVEGAAPAAVAARLNLSVGAVYVAKCRALARLKQQIAEVEGV